MDATSAHPGPVAAATPPAQRHRSLAVSGLLALPRDALSRILEFVEHEPENAGERPKTPENAFFERSEYERRSRGEEVEASGLAEFLSERTACAWQAVVKRSEGKAAARTVGGAESRTSFLVRSVGKQLRSQVDSCISTLPISVTFNDRKSGDKVLDSLHTSLARMTPLWSSLARVDLTLGCPPPIHFPGNDLSRTLAVLVASCPNLVKLKMKHRLLPLSAGSFYFATPVSPLSLESLSALTRLEDLFMEATSPLVLDENESFPTLLSLRRLTLHFQVKRCFLTLAPLPALQDLHIQLLRTDLRHLASSTRLRVLSLHNAKIRVPSPQVLEGLPSLQQLHLFSAKVDPLLDLGAARPSLSRLVIGNNFYENASDIIEGGPSAYMTGSNHLQWLWLAKLSLPQGLALLRQTALTELNLCDVEVPALDLSCQLMLTSLTLKRIRSKLEPRLPWPCALTFLEMKGEPFQSLDLEHLPTLKTLRLASVESVRGVRNLGRLTGLTSLRLGPSVSESLLYDLLTLQSLQRLVLRDLFIGTPLWWPDFSMYSDLQHLELAGMPWTCDSARPLQLATSLRVLEVQSCRYLRAIRVENLVSLRSLFLDRVPSLRELEGLGHLTGLKTFCIVEALVKARTLAPLKGLQNLEKVNIQGCKWLEDMTSLGELSALVD